MTEYVVRYRGFHFCFATQENAVRFLVRVGMKGATP